jgi:small-conductance mechanosensitive channel
MIIMWRNVFVIGDRIEITEHKGDVIGLSVFYFTLMEIGNWVDAEQSTGRLIKVPNSLVLTQPITNYTKSFPYIWDEISIGVRFDSDWRKAREIMKEIAKQKTVDYTQNAKEYVRETNDELIRFHYLTPKVYIKPVMDSPSGIILTLRYLCEPRKRRDMEDALWEEILNRFESNPDITIAHA